MSFKFVYVHFLDFSTNFKNFNEKIIYDQKHKYFQKSNI